MSLLNKIFPQEQITSPKKKKQIEIDLYEDLSELSDKQLFKKFYDTWNENDEKFDRFLETN